MFKFAAACVALVLWGSHGAHAIIGGSTTTVQKHPYQVAVDRIPHPDADDPIEGGLMCGGALIGSRTVVTAASCFPGTTAIQFDIQVRVGALFREGGGEIYNVTDYAVYPNYVDYSGYNDVILLYLDTDVTERAEVKPIALANPNVGFATGDTVVITGYGDLYEGEVMGDGLVRQLQAVSVPIFSSDVCAQINWFYEDDTRDCVGGAGAGTCGKRDIGSPVVNWLGQLVGIGLQRSGQTACGVLGQPTVFQSLLDADIWAWVTENTDPAPQTTTVSPV